MNWSGPVRTVRPGCGESSASWLLRVAQADHIVFAQTCVNQNPSTLLVPPRRDPQCPGIAGDTLPLSAPALGPDSKLLDTSEIAWVHNPDDNEPMTPVTTPSTVPHQLSATTLDPFFTKVLRPHVGLLALLVHLQSDRSRQDHGPQA